MFCLLLSCNDDKAEGTGTSSTTDSTGKKKDKDAMPYTATYSSDFEIGKEKHARIVLDIWKAYEENAFDRVRDHFADTITVINSDGIAMTGPRDSIIQLTSEYRNSIPELRTEVDAWLATHADDRDQYFVNIWGKEVFGDGKGKLDSMRLHEVWMFNEDDKIIYMTQYAGAYPED